MAKANFDDIYVADDPRPYFQTLGALDYQIPAHGASVFSIIAEQVAEVRGIDTVTVTDLCCSYGINSAVMRYDASFNEVVSHYTAAEAQVLERGELVARDRGHRLHHGANRGARPRCRTNDIMAGCSVPPLGRLHRLHRHRRGLRGQGPGGAQGGGCHLSAAPLR